MDFGSWKCIFSGSEELFQQSESQNLIFKQKSQYNPHVSKGAVIYSSVQHPAFLCPLKNLIRTQTTIKNTGKTQNLLLYFEDVGKGKGGAALEQLHTSWCSLATTSQAKFAGSWK